MTIRQNIRRPNFLSHPGRKEPIRQEKTEEVDQSGNGKVAHSGVKSQSNRYLKVSEMGLRTYINTLSIVTIAKFQNVGRSPHITPASKETSSNPRGVHSSFQDVKSHDMER